LRIYQTNYQKFYRLLYKQQTDRTHLLEIESSAAALLVENTALIGNQNRSFLYCDPGLRATTARPAAAARSTRRRRRRRLRRRLPLLQQQQQQLPRSTPTHSSSSHA
jgi:hypothetical protein